MNKRHRSRAIFQTTLVLSAVLSASASNFHLATAQAQIAADDAPIDMTIGTGIPADWLTYGGDLQRTGAVNLRLSATPNLMWRYSSDLAPKINDTTPLVIGPATQRRIYFSVDRYLVCLDGQTGAQLWRSKPLQRPVASPITLVAGDTGDMILAVTSSGQLNALRTSDGGQLWQVPASAPVQNIAPVVVKTANGDRIVIALATGRLLAYTLDGQLDPKWEVRLGSYSATPTATPALSPDGKFLYIPTQDKRLFVINVANSSVEFPIALDTGTFTPPVVTGEHLVLVTGTTLQGLKLRTGQTQWRYDVKSDFGSPAVLAAPDGKASKIFVGARNGKFYAVNADTGSEIWQTDLADSITGIPVVTNGMILVGTRSGLMFGLSPDNGRVLWRYRLHTQRTIVIRDRSDDDNAPRGNVMPTGYAADAGDNGIGFPGAAPGGAPGIGAPAGGIGGPDGDTGGTRTYVQNFGVSSMPAVVGDAVYVLGDNASLYAFSTQPFDADPPQILNPQLSIPNSVGKPALQRLDSEKPLLVPGRAPIQLIVEISDIGSGVDPESIRVSLNNQELPRTALAPFVDTTGRLLITLVEQKGNLTASLDDGLFNVAITARDFRGNEMNWTGNFLVDNTVAPPAAPRRIETDDNNNR